MADCAAAFAAADPDTPCWTYAGPGVAAFWLRRAAVETWLHRVDVADALGQPLELEDHRAADAIEETFSFTYPMAFGIVGEPASRLVVESPCLSSPLEIGNGDSTVTMRGSGRDLLLALWGRHRDGIETTGDADLAAEWLSLAERAFAGRG